MKLPDPLASFIDKVGPVVRAGRIHLETVLAIEPWLADLVTTADWLEPRHCRPMTGKPYAQYLLYRPEDLSFSIVSFVWAPTQGSPIHDHCTWGVVGQYSGEEEETRYRRVDDESRKGWAVVEEAAVAIARRGCVAHVFPPERDIHRIINRTATPVISIHIYGGDIGSQHRHVYQFPSGPVSPFVSGYDPTE